jgi:hypothetical protein
MAQEVKTCAVFVEPSTDGTLLYEVRVFNRNYATCTCKGWLANALRGDEFWCKHVGRVLARHTATEWERLTAPFMPNGFPAPLVSMPFLGGERFTISGIEFCFAEAVNVEVRHA